jgi:hypothetical protein
LIRKSRYGLGEKRTLAQAVEFTGINLRERKMKQNKCGNLIWVPFEESSDYGVTETLSRGHAGEVVLPFVTGHSSGSGNQLPDSGLADHATPIHVVFSGSQLQSEASMDWRFAGGLVCAMMALIVRMSTMKRKKDDKHNE